ncbi:histidine phosphatase family protein [Ideonella azotifigens]|uniref:Alpha-ribazole phosphatase n=1 Tax=Ideonella azotifigens TaxID=513160 RepID=A0ABN1KEA4_9BURK|nr:histidine phosphatase family protein [Ideonella azotifigens]MCD2340775.1 histidine phosphatase family protein [Ideonella azotifigens]
MALILLRHTRVDAPAGLCYGWHDVALLAPPQPSFDDVQAALQALLARLGLKLAEVHSSPLQRAALLAQHLAEAHAARLTTDARWRELSFGEWEGRRWDFIDRAQSDPWAEDPLHRAPPGGETLATLAERVRAARDGLRDAASRPGEAVLAVGHAGPMRVLLADALGLPLYPPVERSLDFGGLLALRPTRDGWCLAEEMP